MALVRVLSPQSESEIAVVTSLLEAHDIPVFVHGRHLGSLLPGLQIGSYNTQSIMVPEECVTDALELLTEFKRNDSSTPAPLRGRDRLRIVLEGFLFGWLVPGRREDETWLLGRTMMRDVNLAVRRLPLSALLPIALSACSSMNVSNYCSGSQSHPRRRQASCGHPGNSTAPAQRVAVRSIQFPESG